MDIFWLGECLEGTNWATTRMEICLRHWEPSRIANTRQVLQVSQEYVNTKPKSHKKNRGKAEMLLID